MRKKRFFSGVLALVCCAALLVWGAGRLQALERREAARVLEKSLRRAAVSCYALEGRYPQDLDALLADGGMAYDEERFLVYYDIFADNILPDITVLER